MTEHYRNYTEIGLLFPNRETEGHSGPVTSACPLIVTPGAQIVMAPHPKIKGALQVSILREQRKVPPK